VVAVKHKERSPGESDRRRLEYRGVKIINRVDYRLRRTVCVDVRHAHMRVVLIHRRAGFLKLASRVWLPALAATGLTGTHFHDLRHAGNLLIAYAGANLRELMERMGHSSSRAALIYLHSTSDRQRTLADAVADRARAELGEASPRGTSVARTGMIETEVQELDH
jgi:integrase